MPWKLVHVDDVAEDYDTYPPPADAVPLAFFKDLGKAAGSASFGVSLDRIPPGSRSGLLHAHSHEEEFVYVLRGTCTLQILEPGGTREDVPVRAGHVVAYPAGTAIAHSLVNEGSEDCVVLVIGERRPGVDRVCYPEDPAYEAALAARRPARFWAPGDRPR
jgi:uncharacterized cupin superfamily protein